MRLDAGPGYPSKSKTNRTSDTSPANHHAGPTGYRLVQPHPRPAPGPVATPLTTSEAPAPALSLNEAKERLDTTGLLFLFFADPATGRGGLVHRTGHCPTFPVRPKA